MPTILCVDDSATIRALVQAVLSKDGIKVVPASNGAEALELVDLSDQVATETTGALGGVVARARDCGFAGKLVAPYRLRRHLERLEIELRAEVCGRMSEAVSGLKSAARRGRQPELGPR